MGHWTMHDLHRICSDLRANLRHLLQVYAGGIENVVNAWDLRKGAVSLTLTGHSDTITSLAVSPDGSLLLTNSMVGLAHALCNVARLLEGRWLLGSCPAHRPQWVACILRPCSCSQDSVRVCDPRRGIMPDCAKPPGRGLSLRFDMLGPEDSWRP